MKISNSSYIAKGITLLITGLVIAFFPGVIGWLFYVIGGIIVISCVLLFLTSLSGGDFMLSTSIFGILIGIGIMALPRFLSVTIPLVAGVVFGIMGITRLISAASKKKSRDLRIGSGIVGAVLLCVGIFLIANPFKATAIARIMIGVVLFIGAAYNFYVAHVINQRNSNTITDIIDDN